MPDGKVYYYPWIGVCVCAVHVCFVMLYLLVLPVVLLMYILLCGFVFDFVLLWFAVLYSSCPVLFYVARWCFSSRWIFLVLSCAIRFCYSDCLVLWLQCFIFSWILLLYSVLYYVLYYIVIMYVLLCFVALLSFAVSCCVVLNYAGLCCIVLCCIVLYCIKL